MPITKKQLSERLIMAAKARRDIRKATLALKKFGEKVIKIHNERNLKRPD